MRSLIKASLLVTIVVLWAGSAVRLSAETTIYDSSVNDLTYRFNPGTLEVGDEILLGGTERYLKMFSFEFWGTNTAQPDNSTFAGAVEARVRFYENTGAPFNGYPTPSPTSFYDSPWFSVSPTARSTIVFNAGSDWAVGGLFIPTSDMTWSVQFRGMNATDSVGVDIYSPPTVGSSYPDYWENNGGWMLKTNPAVAMNFAALMQTPEPSTLTLSILGGLSILAVARRLRRKD